MIPLTNHLWQSTLFAAAALALTFALRDHRAHIRYWIWFAASLKFLIPFSMLVSLGERSAPAAAPAPPVIRRWSEAAEPLAVPVSTLPIPDTPSGDALLWLLPAVWFAGFALVVIRWAMNWRRLRALRVAAAPSRVIAAIPVYETASALEPGVCGIFRPVLLMPAGLESRLTPQQFQAILAHESCHARRRDNLTAAIHMMAEALFWFHPLVWWIGARLIEERERACDEQVLREGVPPRAYAEGITAVCRICLESPLPCAAGVTGADLQRRIRAILSGGAGRSLGPAARASIGLAGAMAVLVPMLTGFAQSQPDKLRFEAASIRESTADHDNSRLGPGPGGGFETVNARLLNLITFAHGVHEFRLARVPGWAMSARYDILATIGENEEPIDKAPFAQLQARIEGHRERLRLLLTERFQLQVHRESKEMPVYALTIAKGGHKLKEVRDGENPPRKRDGRGKLAGQNIPVRDAARSLAQYLGREVIDETGLQGLYDFELSWTPDSSPEQGGPSLFTALQEQLGLKLESKRAPVDVLVIDKLERPSGN